MQLLYFGWVRSQIGVSSETIELPNGVKDVAALIDWLKTRGDGYAAALGDLDVVRVAVNQELTDLDKIVANDDEIALFPPMTGG